MKAGNYTRRSAQPSGWRAWRVARDNLKRAGICEIWGGGYQAVSVSTAQAGLAEDGDSSIRLPGIFVVARTGTAHIEHQVNEQTAIIIL